MPILNLKNTAGEFEPIPAMIGPQGAQGVPGPNEITTATATPLSGVLVGKDGHVEEGVAGEDFAEVNHAHGNITHDGKVGTAAGLPLFTVEGGAVGTKPAAEALVALGTIPALRADVSYYLSPSGSDATGDGTSGNPWHSINKALAAIPKHLNGYTATINMAAGTYAYAETQIVKDYLNGTLRLIGAYSGAGANAAPTTEIQNAQIHILNSATIRLENIKISTNQGRGILADNSTVYAVLIVVAGISSTVAIDVQNAAHFIMPWDSAGRSGSAVSNCRAGIGITNAFAYAYYTIGGSGNTNGIECVGSLAHINAAIPATTQYITARGGRIYSGAQESAPSY